MGLEASLSAGRISVRNFLMIIKQGQKRRVTETPVSTSPSNFFKDAYAFERRHKIVCRGERHPALHQSIFDKVHVDQRSFEQEVNQAQAVDAQVRFLNKATVSFTQANDRAGRFSGLGGRLRDTSQEEAQPPFPIAIQSNCHQTVVVLSPVSLEEKTQVEERSLQDPSMD